MLPPFSWGCIVHYLACTAQPRGFTGMGQVLTFARVGVVEYRASENVAPAILGSDMSVS